MNTSSVASSIDRLYRAVELRDIHLAVCRARKQAACCSTCSDLSERVDRLAALVAAERWPEVA